MEPITAFGLAVNIVQLIDFGARLLREAHEIHQSSSGHTMEHAELRQISEDLLRMCDEVPSIASNQSSHSLVGMVPEISKIAADTKTAAGDLIAAIERLKRKSGSKSRWKSFRQALATVWSRDEIEKMHARLRNLRSQLQSHMITHIS